MPARQTTAFLALAHHLEGFDHRLVQTTLARGTTAMVTVFHAGGAER